MITAYDARLLPSFLTLQRTNQPTLNIAQQTRNVAGLVTKRRTNVSRDRCDCEILACTPREDRSAEHPREDAGGAARKHAAGKPAPAIGPWARPRRYGAESLLLSMAFCIAMARGALDAGDHYSPDSRRSDRVRAAKAGCREC
jgi:hypothetical protein